MTVCKSVGCELEVCQSVSCPSASPLLDVTVRRLPGWQGRRPSQGNADQPDRKSTQVQTPIPGSRATLRSAKAAPLMLSELQPCPGIGWASVRPTRGATPPGEGGLSFSQRFACQSECRQPDGSDDPCLPFAVCRLRIAVCERVCFV